MNLREGKHVYACVQGQNKTSALSFILHIVCFKLEGNLYCFIVEQIVDNYLVVLVN